MSDSEFAELFRALGAEGMHAKIGGSLRQIYGRRTNVQHSKAFMKLAKRVCKAHGFDEAVF